VERRMISRSDKYSKLYLLLMRRLASPNIIRFHVDSARSDHLNPETAPLLHPHYKQKRKARTQSTHALQTESTHGSFSLDPD
jgi:hypothetical protein